VDRVLRIRSHMLHEITLSYMKGHERVLYKTARIW